MPSRATFLGGSRNQRRHSARRILRLARPGTSHARDEHPVIILGNNGQLVGGASSNEISRRGVIERLLGRIEENKSGYPRANRRSRSVGSPSCGTRALGSPLAKTIDAAV